MPNKVQTPTNPVNDAHKSYKQSRTTFPTSYPHYTTELYGFLQPFYVMEGVEGDTIPLNSHQEVRTLTLKAPLMSKITKSKDYYAIPMRAILPKTWEQIYTNPTQGDDIPEDANCCISVRSLLLPFNYLMNVTRTTSLTLQMVERAVKVVLFSESILSDGSLLSKLGCHLSPLFRYYRYSDGVIDYTNTGTFDEWFDVEFIPWFKLLHPVVVVNGSSYALLDDRGAVVADYFVSLHRLLDLMRDYADWSLSTSSAYETGDTTTGDLFKGPTGYIAFEVLSDSQKINISRLLAYQIVSYHFYTNDHVDFIYTAQLYRGMMLSAFGDAYTDGDPTSSAINSIRKYYSYNGELLEYDVFSSAVLDPLLSFASPAGNLLLTADVNFKTRGSILEVFRNIFGYNRSLRYGDYFTGSRPSPLAVGDINTAVVNSEVNALDMTKSLLMQRFLNSVNRVGRKFSSYVQMLSGRLPASDPTNPIFLAHTTDVIGSYEVENTSDDQGKIVTNMRDGSSKYAFSYDVNEPCIVMGISWYEVARIYSQTIDRHFFHKNRYDMFNKFFQYGGDQAIYLKELDPRYMTLGVDEDSNFSYTLRYMEYKQRIPICSGGFRKFLPGYAFITDKNEQTDNRISPEFIRSRADEFDQFFSSLTGYSLGSYFHFIVKYVNECDAQRQMEYAPSML